MRCERDVPGALGCRARGHGLGGRAGGDGGVGPVGGHALGGGQARREAPALLGTALLEALALLRLHLHPSRGRQAILRDSHSLYYLDARGHNGLVLDLRVGHELVDLSHAEPVQHVWGELVEALVGEAGHAVRLAEVGLDRVALGTLASIVHEELGHLAQGVALLARVDDEARAAGLSRLDAALDTVEQRGPARGLVAAEDVRVAGLVVDANGERLGRIRDGGHAANHVHGHAIDGGHEKLDVGARDELRVHACGLLMEDAAQVDLGGAKALGHPGQVPDRLHCCLCHHHVALRGHDGPVLVHAALLDGALDLGNVQVGPCDGNRGAEVELAGLHLLGEDALCHVAPRVNAHNTIWNRPCREGAL
mmetsp:Transcript_24443/g.66386  ORF Transcript_24443/g.66386 Transcript_24443/m.66386 type:complete len:365 (+) Transcript_24443:461-1555(+)